MTADTSLHPPNDSWVAAVYTSPVFVENGEYRHPVGTAVVVDDARLLTCAHVVKDRDELWVAFPKAEEAAGEWREVAEIKRAEQPMTDLALLTLRERIPDGVSAATLRRPRASALRESRWWAFGFPDAFGHDAQGTVSSSLGHGLVHLSAKSDPGIKPGFSGAGLWSPDYEAVVGIVAHGNETGDGRAVTLFQAVQADRCFPGERLARLTDWAAEDADELAKAAWGWSLDGDPEAGRHWRPRARGVTMDSERGHRFRGRRAALTAITRWLERRTVDRRALVLTGSPGVGKSAVLGRIVTTADRAIRAGLPPGDAEVRAAEGSVGCAVHTKGKSALDVAREIARAASCELPELTGDLAPSLLESLTERANSRRLNIVIDALDEAVTPIETRAIITQIVLPLVETCAGFGVQVVVGTRRYDEQGDLLRTFGHASHVIDLDDPRYFSREDLTAYALATLRLTGNERAGNPYDAPEVAAPVAESIARRSHGNFLIAGLVARAHALHDTTAIDPEHLTLTPDVDAALNAYLAWLPPVDGIPAVELLTALAFAEASGWTTELWRVAIEAITGHGVTGGQLARFARSSAGNFLVEVGAGEPERAYRLFHQALNESLLAARSALVAHRKDQRDITHAFAGLGRRTGWRAAPAYLLRSLPVHAHRGNAIDLLLADDLYLLYADLNRLTPLADHATNAQGRTRARLLQLTPRAGTAGPEERAAQFSVTETLENLGDTYTGIGHHAPYRAGWASSRRRSERTTLEGHVGSVHTTCGFLADGRVLLASGGVDRVVRVWDPTTGRQLHAFEGHTDSVSTVCAVGTGGTRTLLASASGDTTVRLWDPTAGRPLHLLRGHTDWVTSLCAFSGPDGVVRLASGSDDRTVRVWDPVSGHQLLTLSGHTKRVSAVCPFTAADGRPLLASASGDTTLRVWDAVTGRQLQVLRGHTSWVTAVCAFPAEDGRTLLASAGDKTVRVWDPATGRQLHVLEGHTDSMSTVCAFVSFDGRAHLASAGGGDMYSADRTVRIWDPATGGQVHVLEGHADSVSAVCAITGADDHALLATAGDDETVRVWDPATGQQIHSFDGHTSWVTSVCAFTTREGHTLLASGSDDRTVRIWDPSLSPQDLALESRTSWVQSVCGLTAADGRGLLATGTAVKAEHAYGGAVEIWESATGRRLRTLEGHTDWVTSVCAFTARDGRTLVASGSDDQTVRVWDPLTGDQLHVLQGQPGWVRSICSFAQGGQSRLATAGKTVEIWSPDTGERLDPVKGRMSSASSICALDGADGRPLLAASGADRVIRVWDPATGRQVQSLEGHTNWVRSLCALTMPDGRVLLASGSDDRTVRVWDPISGRPSHILEGHTDWVRALCAFSLADGRVLLASGGNDRTVRVWDPVTAAELVVIPTHHRVQGLAPAPNAFVIGLEVGLLTIRLDRLAGR